jgi:hypothetical protein
MYENITMYSCIKIEPFEIALTRLGREDKRERWRQ